MTAWASAPKCFPDAHEISVLKYPAIKHNKKVVGFMWFLGSHVNIVPNALLK